MPHEPDARLIRDATLKKLSSRYPGVLDYYKSAPGWQYSTKYAGFVGKATSKPFFEVFNGPWPMETVRFD